MTRDTLRFRGIGRNGSVTGSPHISGTLPRRNDDRATLPVYLRPRILTMKVRELLKLLADDGWYPARTRGSHQQFKHPTKPGLVTVVGKPSDEIAPGTLNSILKQAGLK